MRCEDLTRELASPTGTLHPDEIAGHLAACPACAEWSRHAERFDRIWEATRPTGPSMDAMDALWAKASRELDALEVPATLEFATPARARRRWLTVAFGVAQAAAILIAALVFLRRDGAGPIQVAVGPPAETKVKAGFLDLPVDFDKLAVVWIDGKNKAPRTGKGKAPLAEMQDLTPLYSSPVLPPFTPHDEVGEMEAMASSLDIVASSQ